MLFVLRMLGDSGPRMHWLLWLTPFGWAELLRPFTRNALLPLLPAVAAALVLTAMAIGLSARRDTGSGLLASRDTAAPRLTGLRSPTALAARLELPTLAGWCAGACAAALSLGALARVVTDTTTRSFANVLDKFAPQGDLVDRYLGVAFLFVAAMRGTSVGFGSMVTTGLNVVPTTLLGIGACALALAPRAAGVAVYIAVIGSLLADMLGSLQPSTHWLRNASLFHYMASAPTESPDATTIFTTIALSAALCALACVLYKRRDLQLP